MTALLWLAVAVPLLGALAVGVAPWPGRLAALVAVGAAVPAVALLVEAANGSRASSVFSWLPAARLSFGLSLDALSGLMSALVGLAGAVVVTYAAGYFAEDARRRSALAGLLAFLAAMQGLVLAESFLPLLVFWELVGVASARLIAYSRDDSAAAPGAVRAFLTTRAADVGLYLALLALFAAHGSLSFTGTRPEGALGALVGIGLLTAAMGKSAQAPLQTWLSGAMAGPTPVSALLHSATMVAAGVYLLTRSADLLAGWPLQLAGWVGAVTAVLAALIALAQNDLKRVLAGSTSSHLGLMFVGLAAGGPAVAMFHLVAHAAGKAGLFLAAGTFQHQRSTTTLAGLRGAGRDDRVTFAAFSLCALSIAAVPPLAVFWSKEHIAAASEQQGLWFAAVLVAAAGSAAYLVRPALILWGAPADARAGTGAARTRARTVMTGALVVPVVACLLLGAAGGPLSDLLDAAPLPSSTLSLVLSMTAVSAGLLGVLARPWLPGRLVAAARRQLFATEMLDAVAVRPARLLARGLDPVAPLLDRAVDTVAEVGLHVARIARRVDQRGIDNVVDGAARLVGEAGGRSRLLQSGRWFEYLRDAMLGLLAVALLVALTAVLS